MGFLGPRPEDEARSGGRCRGGSVPPMTSTLGEVVSFLWSSVAFGRCARSPVRSSLGCGQTARPGRMAKAQRRRGREVGMGSLARHMAGSSWCDCVRACPRRRRPLNGHPPPFKASHAWCASSVGPACWCNCTTVCAIRQLRGIRRDVCQDSMALRRRWRSAI